MTNDYLIRRVGDVLTRNGHKLVVAESCTGGAIAAALTSLPGSSVWFERGFVAYSNEAKKDMLGVTEESGVQHGSVSGPVVKEMLCGALENSAASIALAVTGVAGPGGGTAEKPVGTVWLAWSFRNAQPHTRKLWFEGDRARIREQSIDAALGGLCSMFD